MGKYLNPQAVTTQFQKTLNSKFFVDKSLLIADVIPFINTTNCYLCITRPRRFGKSIAAQMVSSFFGKLPTKEIFKNLKISKSDSYLNHLNQHNVIFIDFSQDVQDSDDFQKYLDRKIQGLKKDLMDAFPDLNGSDCLLSELLSECLEKHNERFIFVFDEWDCVFSLPFMTDANRESFVRFLKDLLKDRPYVDLAYMTGVMPILKYSSGSDLNMFVDYTMLRENKFNTYFGFTENEVDELFERYSNQNLDSHYVTRDKLKFWYDGYKTNSGEHIYNPRSVNLSLSNNNIASYWTSSGPYDEVLSLLKNNIDDIQKPVSLMIAGNTVNCLINEYSATSKNLFTKEQIFSAMVVYGLLTSEEENTVRIPNYEILMQFDSILRQSKELGYIYKLAMKSEEMLEATLNFDTKRMTEILDFVHNTETPIFSYNNENELSAIVNLVYLAANDRYFITREDKAGKGFADFLFSPKNYKDDCIIIELKINSSPENAILQIKEKQYALKFEGKIGASSPYTGRKLAVGISYDKDTKKHSCMIEEL